MSCAQSSLSCFALASTRICLKFDNVALAGMLDDVAYIPIEPEPDYAAHLVSELDVNNVAL